MEISGLIIEYVGQVKSCLEGGDRIDIGRLATLEETLAGFGVTFLVDMNKDNPYLVRLPMTETQFYEIFPIRKDNGKQEEQKAPVKKAQFPPNSLSDLLKEDTERDHVVLLKSTPKGILLECSQYRDALAIIEYYGWSMSQPSN